MRALNATMQNFVEYTRDRKMFIYGLGRDFQDFKESYFFDAVSKNIDEYIDNGKAGQQIMNENGTYIIKSAECLQNISQGVILICTSIYMDEIYQSLCGMNLPDGIECFFLPIIWAATDGADSPDIKEKLWRTDSDLPDKIEKKIHCFWFSGEEKPDKYKRCMDSWNKVCPEYDIVEWNAENYDVNANLFMKQAFETEKWAFVSDYARLDVVYRYGGIYLDLDVELKRDFEPLLKTDAFFSFGRKFIVDLGTGFGSVAGHPFIKNLLDVYKDKGFLDEEGKPMVSQCVQPKLLNQNFLSKGLINNGNMQMIDGMLFLPRKYYSPVDDYLHYNHVQNEDTRGIHWFNAGWVGEERQRFLEKNKKWITISRQLI